MGCKASFVLPTRGNTKLFQPQRFRQSLLRKGLLGEHCGESIRSLVALWRISAQGGVGQAAKHFVVEVLVDPVNLMAGRLFDNAIRASHMVVGRLVNNAEGHHLAASSSD